jgi:hypothetical protein
MRLAFQFQHLAGQRAGMGAQQVGIELDAGAFDARQDRQQRHFDVAVDRGQAGFRASAGYMCRCNRSVMSASSAA